MSRTRTGCYAFCVVLIIFVTNSRNPPSSVYKGNPKEKGEKKNLCLGNPEKITEIGCQEMDGDAFTEEIYNRYKRLIVYTLRKYHSDESMIEDLTQTVLVKLYRVRDQLAKLSSEKRTAYIVSTAQHTAYDYNERSGNAQRLFVDGKLDAPGFQIPDPTPSVEDIVIRNEVVAFCRKGLENLPENEKLLLYGKYYMKLSNEELAKQVNCKPDSIRMMLTRARRQAKKWFLEKGVDDFR